MAGAYAGARSICPSRFLEPLAAKEHSSLERTNATPKTLAEIGDLQSGGVANGRFAGFIE